MDIQNCSTALFVKDIEISKDFYINVLGLQVNLDFGKNVIFKNGFAIWEIRDSHIIPQSIGFNKISDESVNRFELYFETTDLNEISQVLKTNNIKFLHEIHEEAWGQQTIRFFDPDNHLIEIGESMEIFIKRIYDQGLTFEQVSQKTHVPVIEIKRLLNVSM
jgi:catechol 2,3-dioxygenase-like lactoylglutathione lyase family enzyme